MDVAISGSTGLIGTALVKALEKRGDRPIRIVRGEPEPGQIGWDPSAGRLDPADLEGVDAVVNLSGESLGNAKWTPAQKAELERSRVDTTRLLATTMAELENKPDVFLNGSATGYYGDRGNEPLTEHSPPGDTFLAGLVQKWESATEPAEQAGIRVCHLRSGIVLSKEGGAVKEVLLPFKLGLGGRIGDGNQYWGWISIEDEVGAILHLLDNDGLSGPFNLSGPVPATNSRYTSALGKALGRPTIIPTPTFALKLRLGAEATEEMLMASTKVLPEKLLENGYVFRHETVEEAFTEMFD